MFKATGRRSGAAACFALIVVLGLPALAQAQLFPNRTIKRERVPCAAEPPYYGHVRRDYYGYFPTCWSRFPPGWGCPCPNPEAPNPAASYEKYPRTPIDQRPKIDAEGGQPGMGDDEAGPGPSVPGGALDEKEMPPLPQGGGRTPYQLDNSGRPTSPAIPDASLPPENGGRGSTGVDGPRGTLPPSTSLDATPPTGALLEIPRITPPTLSNMPESNLTPPVSMVGQPDATLTSAEASSLPNLGPLPTAPLPDPSIPTESAMLSTPPDAGNAPRASAPVQAPQRRSILGGLFNAGNRRRR